MEYKKYMIAIPCMDMVATQFASSLAVMRRVGANKVVFLSNSMIYDARNMLAAEALDTGADRVLWLDSDMVFQPDLMERLAEDLDAGIDFVCAPYVKRKLPTTPIIFKRAEIIDVNGKKTRDAEVYTDYPKDEVFEIDGCGFGAVMMSTYILKAVADTFGAPFDPMPGIYGEDLSFCWRARELGYALYCDSRIKVGHIGQYIFTEKNL